MSRLQQLIQELCPHGVEYKKLGEIAIDVYRGSGIKREQITQTGIPCVRYGEIYTTYGIWFDKCISYTNINVIGNPKYFEYGDILFAITGESVEDIAKSCAYVGHEKCLAGGDIVVLKHKQNPKYLSYALATTEGRKQKSSGKVKSKVVHSSVPAIKDIIIPVPPLPVQAEIVRILDTFTELTTELIAKLAAELAKRKQQYQFYRDHLLTFDQKIPKVCLKDIALSSCSGGTPLKGNAAYYDGGNIPWLRTQEVTFNEIYQTECFITEEGLKNSAAKWIPANCVIVAISGASAGRCAINKIPLTTNQHCLNIEVNPEIALYRYVYYCVCAKQEELLSKKEGARGDLNASRILSLSIPVPPLAVQARLVQVLDNFEAICADLNIGLPAEITARQKQYEFYRDALLTYVATGDIMVIGSDRIGSDRIGSAIRDLIRLIQFVFGFATVELNDIIVSLNTGLNPRKFFKLNTKDANNYYVTIRELQNNHVVVSSKTDRINDKALQLCNNRSNLEIGDVLFSGTGTIGETAIVDEAPVNWNIKEGVYAIKPIKQMVESRFLMYLLQTQKVCTAIMKKVAGGTVKSIPMADLKRIRLTLPPIEEQRRIVDTLDRFDTLCNDLTSGLPAEIAARQKQYEYFRDTLLAFPEAR